MSGIEEAFDSKSLKSKYVNSPLFDPKAFSFLTYRYYFTLETIILTIEVTQSAYVLYGPLIIKPMRLSSLPVSTLIETKELRNVCLDWL